MNHSAAERTLSLLAILIVIGSIASVVVPFTRAGLPSGHDATAHITYTYLFDRALWQGQVPVRWVEWVRPGEGHPLFNFYPPGFYSLIQLVHAPGLPLSVALKATVAAMWCLGGLFTYVWLKPLGGLSASLGAALFVLSPYLILDAFVRAAYPELAAVAIAPGLLWSIDRVVRSGAGRDALLVAVFTSAMLLCHLLSSLILGPVAAAYALHRLAATHARPRALGLLAAGALLGLGLAAFFVIPSQAELGHVTIGRMTSGDSDYQQHFVQPGQFLASAWGYGSSVPGDGDGMSFGIRPVPWIVLAVAGIILPFAWLTRRVPNPGAIAFWLAIVGFTMWLMTPWATALWRAVPALAFVQFPWRYFMVVSVGIAALSALLLSAVPNRIARAAIVIVLIGLHWQLEREHLKPLTYFPRSEMNIDYPRWSEVVKMGMPAFLERGFTPIVARREAPSGIGRWAIVSGDAAVRAIAIADHRMVLEVQAPAGARLRINARAFPGWAIAVDNRPAPMQIDREYGWLEVDVPPGTHRVEARFTNTPVRTAANAISLTSAAVWLLCALRPRSAHHRAKFKVPSAKFKKDRNL